LLGKYTSGYLQIIRQTAVEGCIDMSDEQQARLKHRITAAEFVYPAIFVISIIIVAGGIYVLMPVMQFYGIENSTGDDFEDALNSSMQNNASNFAWWYKSNMLIQFVLIFTALLATVLASLTTQGNAEKIKYWSVILTGITAALASMQSTFHIRENIETFIKSASNLQLLDAVYVEKRAHINSEVIASLNENDKYKINASGRAGDIQRELIKRYPEKYLFLQRELMRQYVDVMGARMRAWANAGQQVPTHGQEDSQFLARVQNTQHLATRGQDEPPLSPQGQIANSATSRIKSGKYP
jgi:hypothetical protein